MDKEDFARAKELNKLFLKVFLVIVIGGIIFGIFLAKSNDIQSQLKFGQYLGFSVLGLLFLILILFHYLKRKKE